MNIKVTAVSVDELSISTSLLIRIELEYYDNIEIPLTLSGKVTTSGNKTIGFLTEFDINLNNTLSLSLLEEARRNQITRAKPSIHRTNLNVSLNEKIINYIELIREKQRDKSVVLNFTFNLKSLYICNREQFSTLNSYHPLIELRQMVLNNNFEIKHSDWVKQFAPKLGLGNFLLLELRIPDEKNVDVFWKELYSKLSVNIQDMEISIRDGDWQKTMLLARKFYENIKIGDDKPAHKEFKEKFSTLLTKDQYSEEGIKNLYDGIWKFFEFISKYTHDKDKNGKFHPRPISTKEDAYFAYALAMGLLNLIGKKVNAD